MRAFLERLKAGEGQLFLCKERQDQAFAFAWHHHREFELTLIVASRGRRFAGDHIGDYHEGDLVLLGPDLPHTWASDGTHVGPHSAIFIQFDEDIFGRHGRAGLGSGAFGKFLDRSARGMRFSGPDAAEAARRMREMPGLPPVRQLGMLLLVLDLLSQSGDVELLSSRTMGADGGSSGEHPVDRVHRFIDAHHSQPIRVEEAAAQVGMSVSAFCRFFKRSTGKTFTGYVNEIRLGRACKLLIESDASIARIAQDSGFGNLSHFNKRFLASRKLRPKDYRRAFRVGPS